MKNPQLPNFEVLHGLYHEFPATSIPRELEKVNEYLATGYGWYAKNISKKEEYQYMHEDNIELLQELKKLSEEMLAYEGSHVALVHVETGTTVNIKPFLWYIETHTLKLEIAKIKEVQLSLQKYLNDTNIVEFKECSKIIGMFDELFTSIYKG